MDLQHWLGRATEAIQEWADGFGPYQPHASLHVDDDRFAAAFHEFTDRLGDNYPFFHLHYAAGGLADPARLSALTPREREVMSLVATGLSNDEIAERRFVTPVTVKTHANRAMAKLGARDRAQLVVIAYETGLVRAGEPRD
ncbi:DNA-binding CsgD family transcriptional regulator [Streptomyces sp. SAI-133]|nr:DNA-binding CsgD family transcriptional regulator [Streptomyces sp. SAI-133]